MKIIKSNSSKVYKTGYDVIKVKEEIIVWMSIGNSYFKKEKIEEILNFTSKKFSKVNILIPFEPAIYTYLALGYEENKARKKARLNSNRLNNHINKSIEKYDLKNINLVNWQKEVIGSKSFKKNIKFLNSLQKNSTEFKIDLDETTKHVLENHLSNNINKKQLTLASQYIIEELAFILSSLELLKVKKIAYLYHRPWYIYENLINGLYDGIEKENYGFILAS